MTDEEKKSKKKISIIKNPSLMNKAEALMREHENVAYRLAKLEEALKELWHKTLDFIQDVD